jgi:hypothetical protein
VQARGHGFVALIHDGAAVPQYVGPASPLLFWAAEVRPLDLGEYEIGRGAQHDNNCKQQAKHGRPFCSVPTLKDPPGRIGSFGRIIVQPEPTPRAPVAQ